MPHGRPKIGTRNEATKATTSGRADRISVSIGHCRCRPSAFCATGPEMGRPDEQAAFARVQGLSRLQLPVSAVVQMQHGN
jgi:hypothetical protein